VRAPATPNAPRASRGSRTDALEEAWTICRDLFVNAFSERSPSTSEIERELLFCLLGGFGVSFEHNRSAAEVIGRLDPFAAGHGDGELLELLEREFSKPQFEPRRCDGSLRRYRYGIHRAATIIAARRWLTANRPLDQLLRPLAPRRRREFLCDCPGVGPKTASWLLRNTGLGRDLAIVDVHVLRALVDAGRVGEVKLPRDYEHVEHAFLQWCGELNAPPAAFDLFVWEWQRGGFQRAG
jgi:N-glycosylase/DNA lyase